LNVEEIMDWINTMDTYFEFDEVEDKKKVKYATNKLKGHVSIWWDELKIHRERKWKYRIKNWDKMVSKIKRKFMPKDYQLILFIQLQNLRKKGMEIKEYTDEFYRLSIRVGYRKGDVERVSRYIDGMRYDIQDDISLLNIKIVEDSYQEQLKEK
jgi:hypothetical protein